MDLKIHRDFKKIFYKKEGAELRGRSNLNLWILIFILFVTFTAIGFSVGSLNYLEKKMAAPYINWVNIAIPFMKGDTALVIMEQLNNDTETQKKFKFKNVTSYHRFPLAFLSQNKGGTIEAVGRSIGFDDPILEEIFKSSNVAEEGSRPFSNEEDIGVIVTREFLDQFGYDRKTPFIYISQSLDSLESNYVPIPVIAVLKELPGITKFATTTYFRSLKAFPYKGNPFNKNNTSRNELMFFIEGDSLSGISFYEKISTIFFNDSELAALNGFVTPPSFDDRSYRTGWTVSVSFLDELDNSVLDPIFEKVKDKPELSGFRKNIYRVYNYQTYQIYEQYSPDYLSVNFGDKKYVRAFRDYFTKTFRLQIDLAQIEASENYNYVSKLTRIISSILIIFSMLIVSLFISNILSRHLEKIRMNIGTFKAFGLSNQDLLGIYSSLVFRFVLIALLISIALSVLFGELYGVRISLIIVNANIEPGEKYFNLFNFLTLIAMVLILCISFFVTRFTTNKIVQKTPGDLIYDR